MSFEITKISDLCSICQDDRGTGANGERVPRTAFAAIDAEENAYFGEKSGISIRELTVEMVQEHLRPLPDEEIYPLLPQDENLTVAPYDITNFHVKTRPDLFKGGAIDKDRILSGLSAALDHLHALGLAHNDVNPANVMLAHGGEPVLIDFGSCEPFGERLLSAGTPGWCRAREQAFASDKANDEYGLGLMGPWLDGVVEEVEGSVETGVDWRLELEDVPPLEVKECGGGGGWAGCG
ncbi:protein kinase [Parachaetomium inaequale]|uniref:Protein kinase n=1 Tax=Parachaetomium inaequale TaxID=2588326 RepID=A0AAN6PMM6_9PEZI|nr:protein kinase [Parachaetomium inaequale]